MKPMDLLEALGELPEEYIVRELDYKPPRKHTAFLVSNPFLAGVSTAACLLLIVGLGVGVWSRQQKIETRPPQETQTTTVTETETRTETTAQVTTESQTTRIQTGTSKKTPESTAISAIVTDRVQPSTSEAALLTTVPNPETTAAATVMQQTSAAATDTRQATSPDLSSYTVLPQTSVTAYISQIAIPVTEQTTQPQTETTQSSKTEPTDNTATEVQAGDVNVDGELSVTDVISLQKYVLNLTAYNSAQMQAADLNKDNEVDVYDLGLLKHTLLHTFEDERTNDAYEKYLDQEFVKEQWYQGEDGVIYFSDDLGDVQFEPYMPNQGTCDRSQLLLALMYKYPDSKFAAQINSWCEDREAEHNYLRENGVNFDIVQEGVHEIMYAVLTADQLNNFPVYETAGYQIGLSKKVNVNV